MAKIAISYSGKKTKQIASYLDELLRLFWKREDVFIDSRDPEAGDFQDRIENEMANAKVGISILSKENENSPWILWEAGFLSGAAKYNGCKVIPFLFCRSADTIERPMQRQNAFSYKHGDTYEINDDNLNQLTDLFLAINRQLEKEDQKFDPEIRRKLRENWNDIYKESFQDIANQMYNYVSFEDKSAENVDNLHLDSSLFEFETKKQAIYWASLKNPKSCTPGNLEDLFDGILETFVPEEWRYKDEKFNAHKVMVNQTRISTFVAFTDQENILLFDRRKDSKNTSVVNQRWDVFGSVQFENRTLKNKIRSSAFLNAKIEKIKPIYGAAFENNKAKQSKNDVETVVMFGILVYLSKEDLQLALQGNSQENNSALTILSKKEALALLPKDLTSKAYLSIKQLYAY